MKRYLLCLFALLCLTFSGCFRAPKAIDDGHDLRDAALKNYSGNMDLILKSVLDAYKAAQYSQIEDYYQQDLKAIKDSSDQFGKVDVVKAMKYASDADRIRNEKKAKVDQNYADTLATYETAKKDLVIATKLNQVLKAYDDAGVDTTAMQKMADQIMSILKPVK